MNDQTTPTAAVERWNARYLVGTPVTAYTGFRPEDDPAARGLATRTRSKASVLGDHTAVVWVDGHGACIALTHVDPIPAAMERASTPCSPVVPCEDGEPCDRHEREQSHAEGEHELCGPECPAAAKAGA